MTRVIRGFPTENIVACFLEAAGGGNIQSINAACNAPAKSPHLHLSSVYWHSDFFQYELAKPLTTKTINHDSLSGRTRYYGTSTSDGLKNGSSSPPDTGIYISGSGAIRTDSITLLTHNLGYVPLCFVAYGGRMLTNGTLVQTQSGGRSRYVGAFATSSIVGLLETAISTDDDLDDVSRTYQVLVFRNPDPDSDRALFGKEGNNLVLGRGKIDTSRQYLRRVAAGESDFDIDLGRTIDIKGGGVRVATGGNKVSDSKYSGSFDGSDYISVGV